MTEWEKMSLKVPFGKKKRIKINLFVYGAKYEILQRN